MNGGLFTGWADVDSAEQGVAEAKKAGELIKKAGIEFYIVFMSVLKRAIKTTNYVLEILTNFGYQLKSLGV